MPSRTPFFLWSRCRSSESRWHPFLWCSCQILRILSVAIGTTFWSSRRHDCLGCRTCRSLQECSFSWVPGPFYRNARDTQRTWDRPLRSYLSFHTTMQDWGSIQGCWSSHHHRVLLIFTMPFDGIRLPSWFYPLGSKLLPIRCNIKASLHYSSCLTSYPLRPTDYSQRPVQGRTCPWPGYCYRPSFCTLWQDSNKAGCSNDCQEPDRQSSRKSSNNLAAA